MLVSWSQNEMSGSRQEEDKCPKQTVTFFLSVLCLSLVMNRRVRAEVVIVCSDWVDCVWLEKIIHSQTSLSKSIPFSFLFSLTILSGHHHESAVDEDALKTDCSCCLIQTFSLSFSPTTGGPLPSSAGNAAEQYYSLPLGAAASLSYAVDPYGEAVVGYPTTLESSVRGATTVPCPQQGQGQQQLQWP